MDALPCTGGHVHPAGVLGVFLRELVAPDRCCGCGAPGSCWCATCAAVAPDPVAFQLVDGTPVVVRFTFAGPVRRVIIAWKEHGDAVAAGVVRSWFVQSLAAIGEPSLCVVPIPSAPAADVRRGGALLTETVAAASASVSRDLVAIRERADQTGLSRTQRQRNLAGSMRWRGPAGVDVLLVDDLATTGSTLLEAARAVKAGGARVTCALVLARPASGDSGTRSDEGLRLGYQNHAIARESREAPQEVDDGHQ